MCLCLQHRRKRQRSAPKSEDVELLLLVKVCWKSLQTSSKNLVQSIATALPLPCPPYRLSLQQDHPPSVIPKQNQPAANVPVPHLSRAQGKASGHHCSHCRQRDRRQPCFRRRPARQDDRCSAPFLQDCQRQVSLPFSLPLIAVVLVRAKSGRTWIACTSPTL